MTAEDEILKEFLTESRENLDLLDREFVALESDPSAQHRIASIFRAVHTIKGTAGFLGFNRLVALTHAAENLPDDVPEATKKERNQRLLALSEKVGLNRHGSHVGSVRRAFVEGVSERTSGHLVARTTHNLMLTFPGDATLVGRMVDVQVESATAFGLSGRTMRSA